jgi:hypothetical protein
VAKTTLEQRVAFIGGLPWASESQLESSSEDAENASFVTYNIVSSRKEIMVSGSAQLLMDEQGLESKIIFHPSFSSFIANAASIKVVLTPTSYVNGSLYVSEKSAYGFTVKQANGNDVGTEFDWMVIAKLTDPGQAQQALEQVQEIAIQQTPPVSESAAVQTETPQQASESTSTESIVIEPSATSTESSKTSEEAVLIEQSAGSQESTTTESTATQDTFVEPVVQEPASSAALTETAEVSPDTAEQASATTTY